MRCTLSRTPLLFLLLWLPVAGLGQTKLGSVNLGSSTSATITISLSAAGTLSKIDVVTQGASGQDFTSAGTGTCKIGTAYSAGQSCTVGVTFAPRFAGNRYGAVVLLSSTSPLATDFLRGFGVGPQITFNPSPATAIDPPVPAQGGSSGSAGLINPTDVAVDGAGNLYVNSINLGGVLKVPVNGASPSILDPVVDGVPVENVSSVVIDGAGNIFMADSVRYRVVEVRPDGSVAWFYPPHTSDISSLYTLAVDRAGNLFVMDTSVSEIVEYPRGNSQHAIPISVTVDGDRLRYPIRLATDASGNLFITDLGENDVVELTSAQVAAGGGNGTPIAPIVAGKALSYPEGVAFDGAGNMFISDLGNGRVIVVPATGSATYAIQSTVDNLEVGASDLVLDGAGNLFLMDTNHGRVVRVQRPQGPDLSFATAPEGTVITDSPQTVQVQNSGTGALSITGLSYPADFPEDTAGSNPCTTSTALSSGEMCNLNIDFLPGSVGSFKEDVVLTDNTLNVSGTKQKVSVSGVGMEGQILLSATSLSFGVQIVGTSSASQQVTLTNHTPSPLAIVGIQVTGAGASMFIFGSNCPASLPIQASCIIHGHFTPFLNQQYAAAVTITYRGVPSQSISLTGEGVFPPIAEFSVPSLSFGTQPVGTQSASQTVKLTSNGGAPLNIVGIRVTGPNASSFIFGSDCPATLYPPLYCHIHGHFAPTTTGPLTAFITFTIAQNVYAPPITLTGTGVLPPTASLSATSLSFGSQQVGTQSASKSLTLTNKGVSPLQIAPILVTGPNASSFIFGNDCPANLDPPNSCTIHGHFAPTATGPLKAKITLSTNAVGPPQSITLTGTGTAQATTSSRSATTLNLGSQNAEH
jgi:sugar lactone lactonase YvrE